MTTVPALAPAALLAWLVARRVHSTRQRVIAAALTGLLVINLAHPEPTAWPALDAAVFALWYAVTAGAAWSVLLDAKTAHVLAVLVLAVVASPIAYRCGVDVARVAFAVALAAQVFAALRFAFRGRKPDRAQWVALTLALSSLADAFGPWLFAAPDRDWDLGRWISLVTWIVIGGEQAWTLLRRRTGS